jgi:hypothetical protein
LGFRVRYDVTHYLGQQPQGFPDWSHSATLAYDTPCRCAALSVRVEVPLLSGKVLPNYPQFFFVLDLKSLGSFATY